MDDVIERVVTVKIMSASDETMLVKKKRLVHLDELVVGLDALCARLQNLLARLEGELSRSA